MTFVIFILIFLGILFFSNWLVFKAFVHAFAILNMHLRLGLEIAMVALSLGFILATYVAFYYYNIAVRIFYMVVAVWSGLLFYLFFAALIYWLIVLISKIIGTQFPLAMIFSILLTIVVATVIYGIVHANNLQVTRVNVQMHNLPPAWQGKKIVWVSDVHLGDVRNQNFANKVAALVQSQNPDIVFVGGDLYDGVAVDALKLAAPFGQIKALMGVHFITGNHEEITNNKNYTDFVAQVGMDVLNNQMEIIDGVQVVGVDYRDSENPKQFSSILDGLHLNSDVPSILLKHAPNNLEVAQSHNISLQLSGHTHDGQIYPFGLLLQKYFKGYSYGLKNFGSMQIFTSSGVGTWGPPMRVGTKAEIVVINLK